jgi:ABC-type uncharacterized transport system auxiliary subunit
VGILCFVQNVKQADVPAIIKAFEKSFAQGKEVKWERGSLT